MSREYLCESLQNHHCSSSDTGGGEAGQGLWSGSLSGQTTSNFMLSKMKTCQSSVAKTVICSEWSHSVNIHTVLFNITVLFTSSQNMKLMYPKANVIQSQNTSLKSCVTPLFLFFNETPVYWWLHLYHLSPFGNKIQSSHWRLFFSVRPWYGALPIPTTTGPVHYHFKSVKDSLPGMYSYICCI